MENCCNACPRLCGVNRSEKTGYCGVPDKILVARASLHPWEEPCISGPNGSGTVFFCGCNLRCIFCQNHGISHETQLGQEVSPVELGKLFLRLQKAGAANINLVTPTQYGEALIGVLQSVKGSLHIPVVYNCGGYESVELLRRLEGLVDIYLPDMKYASPELSAAYSGAPDYFEVASAALAEMIRQCPRQIYAEDGTMKSGVIVRHLVLPGCRKDSEKILEQLAERFGTDSFLLSLMSQYTPEFTAETAPENLHRRLTTFEYQSVLDAAARLGFRGFCQDKTSAKTAYTPDFSEKGLLNEI